MTKEVHRAAPVWFPEDGTDLEKAAMAFHARREHASTATLPDGSRPPGPSSPTVPAGRSPGAPFHDPCVDDRGRLLSAGVTGYFFDGLGAAPGSPVSSPFNADTPRVYKGANIQFDVVLNKLGYHFPQERILALWEDAVPTIQKKRAPEPMVLRMNTFDCVMYHHTNLVPAVYELDDYQIRTTTDIIGQHIHLPKWDLTTTDGSANGWNYEDGTLSPDAVRERIHAINAFNPSGAGNPADSANRAPNTPLVGPGAPVLPATSPGGLDWTGARTTLQRWFSDPVVNVDGAAPRPGHHLHPRPLRPVHPPAGGALRHRAHRAARLAPGCTTRPALPFYTRPDGGPTSWQAAILTALDRRQRQLPRVLLRVLATSSTPTSPASTSAATRRGGLGAAPDANSFRRAINPVGEEDAGDTPSPTSSPSRPSARAACRGRARRPSPPTTLVSSW